MPDAWPRSPAVVPSTGRSTSRPVRCGTTMPCATARPAGPHRILPTRLLVVATGPGARSRPRDAVAARPCSGALDGTGPAQAGARPPRTSPARAGRGMRRSTVSGTWTCPVLCLDRTADDERREPTGVPDELPCRCLQRDRPARHRQTLAQAMQKQLPASAMQAGPLPVTSNSPMSTPCRSAWVQNTRVICPAEQAAFPQEICLMDGGR